MATRALPAFVTAALVVCAASLLAGATARQPAPAALKDALTFHSPFDAGTSAAFALGDPRLYAAVSRNEAARAADGAPATAIEPVAGGRYGGAARIRLGPTPFVFYRGERNVAWQPRDWSGTVSFWMSLAPDRDLAPGYSDPLIVTSRDWNDGSFFVDFTRDDVPRRFRFAAFADRGVWDPARRDWDAVPVPERPMVELRGPLFGRGRWTHVAWTWSRFNTGAADGLLTCYIDGRAVGTLAGRTQTYSWDPREVTIALGVQFIGLIDDLAIFNRALDAKDIAVLHGMAGGVAELRAGR